MTKGDLDWGEKNDVDVQDGLDTFKQLQRQTSNPDDDSSERTKVEDEFNLHDFMNESKKKLHDEAGKTHKPSLGVTWKNLTVKGAGAGSSFIKTFPDAIASTIFAIDAYNFITKWIPQLRIGKGPPVRNLVDDFTGHLGNEMMLVLGRPGSGCTTFLKALANKRGEFVDVLGDVTYGGLSAKEVENKFRGEVVYNGEDDVHFPTLTVGQTLAFALKEKTPRTRPESMSRSEFQECHLNALLKMFGIEHTKNTVVGDSAGIVRGVSGGERKRVSIAETLVTRASVMCWDNSTRGLDASTAVDYVRSLRIITDVTGGTSIATLYQAGEGIYELFDKVCLIHEGKCIYFGPANEACSYFESLGYYKASRQTSADFLTGLTDVHERSFRKGYENKAPRTPEELENAYKNSKYYQAACQSVDDSFASENDQLVNFKQSVREEKKRRMAKSSVYTVSYLEQIWYCFIRQIQILKNDPSGLYVKLLTIFVISFIVASMFYNIDKTQLTDGAFSRGGTLFFSILFIGWLQLAEIFDAVSGRTIIQRQKEFAFYRPSAMVFARVLSDFPILFCCVTLMSIIVYFLSSLRYTAGQFFIYYLFVFISSLNLTAFYRLVSSISPTVNEGIRFAVSAFNIAVIYTGYVVSRNNMPSWFKWISWINGIPFAFEAVMANEFHNSYFDCAEDSIVPNMPSATEQYQTCSLQGSTSGSLRVLGDDYINTAFGYKFSHVWPNFGYVMAYTVGYIIVTALFAEIFDFSEGGGGVLIFAKTNKGKRKAKENEKAIKGDVETGKPSQNVNEKGNSMEVQPGSIKPSEAEFTFKNVCYTVQVDGRDRRLLDNVTGFVKPGTITALMGASGAGKTTLLNTLSQRMTTGVVSGDMLIDGKPLELNSFQRGTGYVQQGDLHDSFATVRESVEFSAILRQPRETPRHEVLEYVDQILDLLELRELEDAIVGSPDAGLSVEQRKRVTIAVELAAKPDVLLFLDEPTSGLDSQSAYSIGRFLSKLAQAGQAILCTIHQPSSLLFTEFFDRLLLLSPGGKVVYQGPVGDNGQAIVNYFDSIGARRCSDSENVAEYAIEMIAYGRDKFGNKVDFSDLWRQSKEAQLISEEVDRIVAERIQKPRELNEAMTRQFSQPLSVQCKLLVIRTLKNYYRDSAYGYGKLFTTFILAIFNAFTFFKLDITQTALQELMLSLFVVILIPPAILNALIPKYFIAYNLYNTREKHSQTYSWIAFLTSLIVAEFCYSVLLAVVYYVIWWFPIGLPLGGQAAWAFFIVLEYMIFAAGWGLWICSSNSNAGPSFVINSLPFHLVIVNCVSGILVPISKLPTIWRYFFVYLNPLTYFFHGMFNAGMSGLEVTCSENELSTFIPPPGSTCQSYAGEWVTSSGGYLVDSESTSLCQYCPLRNADYYLQSLRVYLGDSWPGGYFGIFGAYTFVSNIILIYLLFYIAVVLGFSPTATFSKLFSKRSSKSG